MRSPTPEQTSSITAPLALVGVGLAFAALPVAGQTVFWAFLLVALSISVRILFFRKNRRLPPLSVKLLVLAGGLGGVLLQFGTIVGVEAGLSVLLVLVSLKFLEAASRRDLQVLTLLGFFLALCDLFFAQDLSRWVYVGGVLAWLTLAVVFSHTNGLPGGFRAAVRTTVLLFLQALPLICILFLFFPRIYGGFRFQFSRSLQSGTGMSDLMQPGSMASLALRHDIALQVSFPDGNLPSQADMYWRGLVLWRGDGLSWVRVDNLSTEKRKNTLSGPSIRQRIVLQPHGGRWLFALDRPASIIQRTSLEPGGYLRSHRQIFYPMSYEVVSRPENRELTLHEDQLAIALQQPQNVSPRVRALAESWRTVAQSDADIVAAALAFFRTNGFAYSLTPGIYGQNELESFLFDRRLGFCEHYAGAFASLMRLAGVPSRVVLGYHGGQFNRHGNYVTVRQSDAHAWCEVWLKGKGWQRVDPTSVIAPERITAGFESYIESQAAQGSGTGPNVKGFASWQNAIRDFRLVWDSLAYRWDLWILNFDEEGQRSFLLMLGMGAWEWTSIAGMLAVGVLFFVGLVGILDPP
ncbi:MAG: DUF3488 domain-containing protein, partial [Verrucomicrobiaceae bacterium]